MTGNSPPLRKRALQAASLGLVLAVLIAVGRLVPSSTAGTGVATALGLLLLLGVLLSEVLDLIRLPHITGYLAAGVLAGPHGLGIIDSHTTHDLSEVNTLALALIALAGGLELRLSTLREVAKALLTATFVHSTLGFVLSALLFFAVRSFLPFAADLSLLAAIGVSILWGVLAISRSPSATLGILSQTRPDGPLTRFSVAFVMTSDIVVVLFMTGALMIARPMIEAWGQLSLSALSHLAHEIYGSICVGTTLGLLLALYLRLRGGYLMIVLAFLGFAFTAGFRYLHLEPLLTFITAGFVVQNLSREGDRLLHAIEETGAIVFVVFFAIAGAHLDLELLGELWPVALLLASGRALSTYGCQILASKWAGDQGVIARYGFSSLVSQAGLTLGLSVLIERTFPELGQGFRALVVATVAINEVIGPICFQWGLTKAGEIGRALHATPTDHHT